MSIIEALISGIVQGCTEFLPVSSSGHLVLVHSLFGFSEPSMFFDICLHLATLGAVIIFFRHDIAEIFLKRDYRTVFLILIATIPAVLAGVLLEDIISGFFTDIRKVSLMLCVTGIVLFFAQMALWYKKDNNGKLSFGKAIIIGIFQSFALIPGISRSGMTISSGILSGVEKEKVFRFSFLLSIPVIFGAAVFKGGKLLSSGALSDKAGVYIIGMITAFITGYISLGFLLWMLKRKRLYIFAIYCIVVGLTGIFI